MKIILRKLAETLDDAEVQMSFDALTIPEILNHFKDFLQGSGFIIRGDIEVVDPTDFTPTESFDDEDDLK